MPWASRAYGSSRIRTDGSPTRAAAMARALALAGVEAATARGGLDGEAGDLQDFADAGLRDAAGRRVQAQVALDGAAGWRASGSRPAHFADRGAEGVVRTAAEEGAALGGFLLGHHA